MCASEQLNAVMIKHLEILSDKMSGVSDFFHQQSEG